MVTEFKGQEQPFRKVEAITLPGEYVFAESITENPLSRVIRSDRPRFETDIPSYLLDRYPEGRLRSILFPPLFPHQPWLGGNGIISFDGEYNEVYFDTGESMTLNGITIAREFISSIKDIGIPTFDSRNPITFLRPRGRDGVLNIRLYENIEGFRDLNWDGKLFLQGEKPGKVIKDSLEYVNDVIRTSRIPVWSRLR